MDSETGEALGLLIVLLIYLVIWATPIILIILGARAVIKWIIREARGENKTKIKSVQAYRNTPDVTKNNYQSVLEQLERLAQLKEKGLLTSEEFEIQKAKLLSS